MGYHRNIVEADVSDIVWLVEAVGTRQTAADRALALHFAFELWHPFDMQWNLWLRLMGIAVKQPGLWGPFWKRTWKRMTFQVWALWSRSIRHKLLDKYWWTHKAYKLQHLRDRLKDLYLLHRHLNWLYSGSVPHWLSSLSHEAQEEHHSSRWAADDWKSLGKKRGPLVAWATRRGCETTWLKHSPLLPHEKPNPNQTSSFTVAGLCGLQSLWHRGKLDFATLSDTESTRAAHYAVNELNGFSDWLPELALAKPQVVRDALLECILGVWEIPPEREHVYEVLTKLAWQGERYWPLIADGLLSLLQHKDPLHPQVLNHSITILLKSPNPPKSQLITLASHRAADYQPRNLFFVAWTALWLQLDARGAMDFLNSRLSGLPPAEAGRAVLQICNSLCGESINRLPDIADPDYLQPQAIVSFVPFIYRHVRPSSDITHENGEAYSPSERDQAQQFRNALLQRLAKSEHPEALAALKALRDVPELTEHRDWITYLVEQNIMNAADLVPWLPEDIRTFAADFEIDPRNDTDLFQIACWRLQDIRREVERSENSLRTEVHRDWNEAKLRQWFQRKLHARSRGRYTIPQEAEIDQEQKPDLRFEHPRIPSAVPVELKWAENWTAAQLLERLENQLVGQYLRAHNIRYGIYLLGYIGKQQQWHHPSEQRMVSFDELVRIIEQKASELVRSRDDVADVRVVPIDFTVRQCSAT
jgi:hypothetical protein